MFPRTMAHGVMNPFLSEGRRVLVAVAAEVECRSVLKGLGYPDIPVPRRWTWASAGPWDVLHTGVSKSNAAAATALALDPKIHAAVVSIGIAGAYPPGNVAMLGTTLAATTSMLADEGVTTPDGFRDCASLGFPLFEGAFEAAIGDPHLLDAIEPHVETSGPVATVSACSGTDHLALMTSARTGAIAECMEGAAVGLVAGRQGVAFLELRTISNTTGDRDRQSWDIPLALERLSDLASRL